MVSCDRFGFAIRARTAETTSILVDRTGKIGWKHYGPILPNDTSLRPSSGRCHRSPR